MMDLYFLWWSVSAKNHTHVKKVGHISEFPFGIYWWTLKNPKNQNFEKMKKNCWRYHHFTYVNQKPQPWGTVPDIQSENFFFCHFGPFFALYPLPLQQPRKPKFWKNGSIWRCHHFKLVLQKTQSHDVCLLRYGVQQT